MIDLHMHTTYSDGTDSVKEILTNASNKDLEIISITDHNSCASYNEMRNFDISKIFKGKIIIGCEFTTSYDNRLIEVLGYGFDYEKVEKILNNFYTKELIQESTNILFGRLLEKINTLGLIINLEDIKEQNFESEFFERGVYEQLIKYPENKEILQEDVWHSFSDFFRKGLTNDKSALFLNYPEFKPSLKEILDLVHNAGGVAFLAHPYQYKFSDTKEFLEKIYNENNFDGVECFYTTFSKEQTNYLIEFARKRTLLISGGSDYHGTNKKKHELGTGRGNLNINKDIISNWNIDCFFDNIKQEGKNTHEIKRLNKRI